MSKASPVKTRLDIFIRVVAFIFIAIAIALALLTLSTSMAPILAGTFYVISAMLFMTGFIVLISKLE